MALLELYQNCIIWREGLKAKTKVKRSLTSGIKKALGLKKSPPIRRGFSEETKKTILKIQNYRCAVFGCKFRNSSLLEFDHINGRNNNSLRNCQVLCPTHHRLKTKRERLIIQAEKRIESQKQRKPVSKHSSSISRSRYNKKPVRKKQRNS